MPNEDVPFEDLVGGTVVEANVGPALPLVIEKDGKRFNVFLEGHDSELHAVPQQER